MKRLFLIPALALSLAGCAGLPGLIAPAPVQQAACVADDRLETAWKAFDLALDAINALGDANVIVPGTPKGKAVAAGIRATNAALGRAERFAVTCSAGDLDAALTDAKSGMDTISTALKGA